jgi:hypothetical protein
VQAYTEAMLHGSSQSDSGMDLRDLLNDAGFKSRPKQPRDPNRTAIAFRHLLKLLAEDRESILKELVDAAMNFCSAESAGISLEETETGTFAGWPSRAVLPNILMDERQETIVRAGHASIPGGRSFTALPVLTMTI